MTHMCHSTPTAGLEAALDVMPLNLHAQCVAVQAVLREGPEQEPEQLGWYRLW